jgi:hypothetical protein
VVRRERRTLLEARYHIVVIGLPLASSVQTPQQPAAWTADGREFT